MPLVVWLAAWMAVIGCDRRPAPPAAHHLAVAAAADLKFAMDDLLAQYRQAHPGTAIDVTYGSSGNFYAQLQNHAPFDLFLSADLRYPRQLVQDGLAPKDSLFTYAIGKIVLWAPAESKLDLKGRGLKALLDERVRKIAIANPQHAPYGRAAEAALKSAGLWEKLQPKIVLGENVAQTAQFAQSGSADVGIIALSLALAPAMKDKGQYFLVPQKDYPSIEQGGVVLGSSKENAEARQFEAFLTGPRGRAILERFGFGLPGEK